MEFGVGFNSSSSCSADHSVNGLKFGKKIYFEDVSGGGGTHRKSGGGGCGGSSSGSPAKKGRSGGGQLPRCQVEGCKVDLSDGKPYYSRHKVCGLHSKTSKVIVAGLEQRFCQQCSRFHLLPEFDQGKRSCRRRLAGHNERRRKAPAGSIMPLRYGSLSSFLLESGSNSSTSRGGGFMKDFSEYPNLSGGSSWRNARQPQDYASRDPPGTGEYLQQAWQNFDGSPPRTAIPCPGFPSGDCCVSVLDSTCALSLLSNHPWVSRTRPSTHEVNNLNLQNNNGAPAHQPFGIHGAHISHFSSPAWGFKIDAVGSSCNELASNNLGVRPMLHNPPNYHNPGELEVSQQSNRPHYLGIDHSRGYDSSLQHINWSL